MINKSSFWKRALLVSLVLTLTLAAIISFSLDQKQSQSFLFGLSSMAGRLTGFASIKPTFTITASKPIAGFVFRLDNSSVYNATVIVYSNTTKLANVTCHTDPAVYSGTDGSYATNLQNLKTPTNADCNGNWQTGDAIWAVINGSTAVPPAGNGNTSGDTIASGTGLQYLSNLTLASADSAPPFISLVSPPNNYVSTSGNLSFVYNVTDASNISNCNLILNNTVNETDTSITKDVNQTFTKTNLPEGSYSWSVNCTDSYGNQNSSEFRNFSVSMVKQLSVLLITPVASTGVLQNQFFVYTAQVSCLGGICGNVNASLFANNTLIPFGSGTPFWTNLSNPADLNTFACLSNMTAGSSCNVTWFVNASGSLGTTREFFALFNSTTYTNLFNETPRINITITSDIYPPKVFNLTPLANTSFYLNTTIEISAFVTDDVNVSTVFANLSLPDGSSQILPLFRVNLTDKYNTSFFINNLTGPYNVTFFANDTSNNINYTEKTYFSAVLFLIAELIQTADRLNYFDMNLNHTVTVFNQGEEDVQANIPLAPGWTFMGGVNCTLNAPNITCFIPSNGTAQYIVLDPGSADPEYKVTPFPIFSNNSYSGNTVYFLKLPEKELFHTLVEYGRGRGNYFYDSAFHTAGSGHSEAGCAYVPNSTLFELNFLHKINNVNQYFGNLSALAYNATFSCTYPNRSVVREHLITNITTNNSGAFVNYFISDIGSSWDRIGFLSMDFKAEEQSVGEQFTINCTNMSYYFPQAGGYMVVAEDAFTLEVRDEKALIASALTNDIIGNGTQEVIITYNLTHNEAYPINNPIIEIQAPPYAEFIGTRGELWGAALDRYRIEKSQMLPGESEIISLAARFDTTNAPNLTNLSLTQGIRAQYVTCWELNAYNPTEHTEDLTLAGAAALDMSASKKIIGVVELLQKLNLSLTQIYSLITDINSTVNNIQTIVNIINTTSRDTNILVKEINQTTHTILNQTQIVLNNTNLILTDTKNIFDQLNCNGTNDSPICDKIRTINQSYTSLYNLTLLINNSADNLNITIIENINTSGVNITVNVDLSNLTNKLREVKSLINCTAGYSADSVCGRVERIENLTVIVNNSVAYLQNMTSYFNTTAFGNITFQQIIDRMSNATFDTSAVLKALQSLSEFDEEIIFLITDSFNFQQDGQAQFNQGKLVDSIDSLTQANEKLKVAADKLVVQRDILALQQTPSSFSTIWIWVGLIIILILVVLIFLFRQVPSQPTPVAQQEMSPGQAYAPNQKL